MGTLLLIMLALYGPLAGQREANPAAQATTPEVEGEAPPAHNRSWIGEDGVHPDATGYMARARAIAKQVKRCRRSLVE